MQIHPLSHVSLLEHAADNPFPGQPPPPVEADGEDEYYVDGASGSRLFGRWRKLQYLVKWAGYDHPTWEDRVHALCPHKPGPLPVPPRLHLDSLGGTTCLADERQARNSPPGGRPEIGATCVAEDGCWLRKRKVEWKLEDYMHYDTKFWWGWFESLRCMV